MKFKLWDRDIERKSEGVGIPQIEKVDGMLSLMRKSTFGVVLTICKFSLSHRISKYYCSSTVKMRSLNQSNL